MTEENQAIEESPEMDSNEESDVSNEEAQPDQAPESQEVDKTDENDNNDEVEFPKKAVNALNRKNKTINKLRAQMRELEAQINEAKPSTEDKQAINPDDFESYGDYLEAQVQAEVQHRMTQSQSDMQKQQLTQQQEQLQAQRDQYIIEQANEVAQTFTDLPQVWQQNAQLLDSLPQEIADIFYGIDNAPAAIYTLAKEGKLDGLQYANPYLAAIEISNAEKRGMEALSKPQQRASQAPQPIQKARGTGSVKKQLTPESDVLKSLGLKR